MNKYLSKINDEKIFVIHTITISKEKLL